MLLQTDITVEIRAGIRLLLKPVVAAVLPEINVRTRRIDGVLAELPANPHYMVRLSRNSAGVAGGSRACLLASSERTVLARS